MTTPRIRHRVAAALALAGTFVAGGCAPPPPVAPTVADARRVLVSPKLATLDDADARLEFAVGERIRIGLVAERVSGRRWRVVSVAGAAVAPHGSPVFAAANIRDLRTPGNWIFEFDAIAPGDARLVFDYRRESDAPSDAERVATYDVRVR